MSSKKILELYRTHGELEYGERCTLNSHMIQAGLIAKEKKYDSELILAAFLHDIGHLFPYGKEVKRMGKWGIEQHDKIAGDYLRKAGLSERVVSPIENHVNSKRYLCYKQPGYHNQLSLASKKTLEYQGGPMQETEAQVFEQTPYFEESIVIRELDDLGKVENFPITGKMWKYFETLVEGYLD